MPAKRRSFPTLLTVILTGIVSLGARYAWAAAPDSLAEVSARYVRYEAPISANMEVREIEVISDGVNVALKKATVNYIDFDGVHPTKNKVLVDGEKNVNARGPFFAASAYDTDRKRFPYPVLDPVVEVDLGAEFFVERVVVYRSGANQKTWMDKGKRQVTLLDAKRRVVSINKYDIWDAPYKAGAETSEIKPVSGKYAGFVLPEATHQWIRMGEFYDLPPLPPLDPAGEARLAEFNKRNSPENVAALSNEFFARVNLEKPELKPIAELFQAGKHQEALDAFKRHFFKRIERLRDAGLWLRDEFSYEMHGADMLDGVLVTFSNDAAVAQRFRPGLIKWVDIPEDPGLRSKALNDCEIRTWPDTVQKPLLMAYKKTGDKKYLMGWAEMSDDWAMNFFRQADASPYNIRNLFVMTPFFNTTWFLKDLDSVAQAQPEFIEALPSTTLARMLMPILEEYPPAFWRVARKCVFNHLLNAWGDAVLPTYVLNDFYAGQRAERENRQQFERMWGGIAHMRDGYTVEMCDEGHSMAPFWASCMYVHLRKHNYDWFTQGHEEMYFEALRKIARFCIHNLGPAGYSEYMDKFRSGFSVVWYHSGLTAWYEKDYYLGMPAKITKPVLYEPEIRAIMDTCFGKGRDTATIQNDQKSEHDQVVKFYEGAYQGAPKTFSEWKPYSGFQYLRRGWKRGDSFLLMLSYNNETTNAGPVFDNTFFRYMDYDMPMVESFGTTLDGQKQYPEYNRKTYNPGSKEWRLAEANEKPIQARWLTSPRYDFAEAFYKGAYQNFSIKEKKLAGQGKAIEDVTATRQVIQVRDYRFFIATDRISGGKDLAPHKCAIDYSLQLTQKKGTVFTAEEQISSDAAKGFSLVKVRNPLTPGVTLAQFNAVPLSAKISGTKPPGKIGDMQAHQFPEEFLFAERRVMAEWQAIGNSALVTAMIPSPKPVAGETPDETAVVPGVVKSIESKSGNGVSGFKAVMADGGIVVYLAASGKPQELDADGTKATAEAILLVSKGAWKSGLLLGASSMSSNSKTIKLPAADFEFTLSADGTLSDVRPILLPVDPVTILPQERVFTDSVQMELKSATPEVEIHFTLDNSEPLPSSPVYTQPVKIAQDTFVRARAFRKGVTELPVDTSGTQVTEASIGWFYKQALREPALAPAALMPGLKFDYFEGTWFKLFSYANLPKVLPALKSGVVLKLLDVSARQTEGPFGMRYSGYIQVPADGVYTFYGPNEFIHNTCEPGYDLRVYVDGEEWYLGQTWHGLGRWPVPLKAGLHRFETTFADARAKDVTNQKRDLWRDYPEPWVVWDGVAPEVEISGPGISKQPIPSDWLKCAR